MVRLSISPEEMSRLRFSSEKDKLSIDGTIKKAMVLIQDTILACTTRHRTDDLKATIHLLHSINKIPNEQIKTEVYLQLRHVLTVTSNWRDWQNYLCLVPNKTKTKENEND